MRPELARSAGAKLQADERAGGGGRPLLCQRGAVRARRRGRQIGGNLASSPRHRGLPWVCAPPPPQASGRVTPRRLGECPGPEPGAQPSGKPFGFGGRTRGTWGSLRGDPEVFSLGVRQVGTLA